MVGQEEILALLFAKMDVDKENTMRGLKNEPFIMKLRCRFGFHTYTVWNEDKSIEKHRSGYHGHIKIAYLKTCINCNTPKWKTVKKPILS